VKGGAGGSVVMIGSRCLMSGVAVAVICPFQRSIVMLDGENRCRFKMEEGVGQFLS